MCKLCKNFQAPPKELKQHQKKSCVLACPVGCGAKMKLSSVEKHTEKKCPNHVLVCPNGCGASMKPTAIKNYTENKCPLNVVNCEFAYSGCLQMIW